MAALEYVRMKVQPDAEEAFIAGRPAVVERLAQFPGFRSAVLSRLDDGLWLDMVLWDTRELAEAAAAQAPSVPELAAWFAHIEDVVETGHATVVHASA